MKIYIKNSVSFWFALYLFLSLPINVRSQGTEKSLKKLFLQSAGGVCTRNGFNSEISVQAVVDNEWTATFSYHNLTMKPGNLPSDYQPETGIAFLIPYTKNIEVNMKLFSLIAGKYFSVGRNSWFTAEGGFSIVNGEKASFKKVAKESSDPLLLLFLSSNTSSNYNTAIEKKSTIGVMLRADYNWAFLPFMGLGTGVFANFNSIQSPIGLQVKLMLGIMRRQSKVKNRK